MKPTYDPTRITVAEVASGTSFVEASPRFHFTSDKIQPEIIQTVTTHCPYDNCELSFRLKETTLMGGPAEFYDKQGIFHMNNPNYFNAELCCRVCWKAWEITRG